MKSFGLALSFLAFSIFAQDSSCPPRWAYCGYNGPHQWQFIDASYEKCAGTRQSPVELSWGAPRVGDVVKIQYKDTQARVFNNGYEIRVEPAPESAGFIEIGSNNNWTKYHLVQFHLHTPSEHRVAGQKPHDAELHLVHQIEGGTDLAVIGVLMNAGSGNDGLNSLLRSLPARPCDPGDTRDILFTKIFAAKELSRYLTYPGSLTTPACAEIVTWYIAFDTDTNVSVTADQVGRLRAVGENARPPQNLGSRTITLVRNQ